MQIQIKRFNIKNLLTRFVQQPSPKIQGVPANILLLVPQIYTLYQKVFLVFHRPLCRDLITLHQQS